MKDTVGTEPEVRQIQIKLTTGNDALNSSVPEETARNDIIKMQYHYSVTRSALSGLQNHRLTKYLNERRGPNDAIKLSSISTPQALNLPWSQMTPNLHNVSNTPHFQSLLSEDLNRISLVYFWAPWAEPCKQMTEVVTELSRKYSEYLFLQVCHQSTNWPYLT